MLYFIKGWYFFLILGLRHITLERLKILSRRNILYSHFTLTVTVMFWRAPRLLFLVSCFNQNHRDRIEHRQSTCCYICYTIKMWNALSTLVFRLFHVFILHILFGSLKIDNKNCILIWRKKFFYYMHILIIIYLYPSILYSYVILFSSFWFAIYAVF